jgi:hypothetical protein
MQPKTITYYGTKIKSEEGQPPWKDSSSCAKDVQVRTWCIHELNVCSFSNITSHRHRLVLFVKHSALHILTSNRCPWWSYQVARTRLIVGLITPHGIYLTIMKPVREAKARSRAMLCMYPDKEVPNKTTVHWLVTKFRDKGSVYLREGGGSLL